MSNPIIDWFKPKKPVEEKPPKGNAPVKPILPGRVSVPDDDNGGITLSALQGMTQMVTPSFRREVIPLLRNLYKVNPDVSIAIQDMFKLANTGHKVDFPNNTDEEAKKMRQHLERVSGNWSRYSAGIDGLINRMIVQQFVAGAISIEAVPNENLDGLSTILFLKPERIFFHRENNGVYSPYQLNNHFDDKHEEYIKLNPDTYFYCSTFNDTDEPYGIPPFMGALDSIKTQSDMKTNMKHIMEIAGAIGFLEALVDKPGQIANESDQAYAARLTNYLRKMKKATREGMKDGIVVGFKDDHEFKLNSTTKDLGNLDKPWNMNQQSIANGLGVNASIIGSGNVVSGEGASGVVLSKMISQLKNLQMMIEFILKKVYSLELLLAGFNNKGIKIVWATPTVTDDVKIQQARQYKIQNLNMLYLQGIISQEDYAYEAGYDSPAEKEPRIPLTEPADVDTGKPATKRDADSAKKEKSNKNQRDKTNPSPKRKDGDSKPR